MSSNLDYNNGYLKSRLYWGVRGAFPQVFNLNDCELLAKREQAKLSALERRARELCKAGVIKSVKKTGDNFISGYVFVPPTKNEPVEVKPELQASLF